MDRKKNSSMRGLPLISCLLLVLSVSAQEKRPLAADYPLVEKKCTITAREWSGKPDWLAKCRLYIYRQVNEKQTDGFVLFDLPLIQAHPATFNEASKAVEKWLSRQSVELLRRNGYPMDGKEK